MVDLIPCSFPVISFVRYLRPYPPILQEFDAVPVIVIGGFFHFNPAFLSQVDGTRQFLDDFLVDKPFTGRLEAAALDFLLK